MVRTPVVLRVRVFCGAVLAYIPVRRLYLLGVHSGAVASVRGWRRTLSRDCEGSRPAREAGSKAASACGMKHDCCATGLRSRELCSSRGRRPPRAMTSC
eukprot:1300790-Prymnesium_polylepis.1